MRLTNIFSASIFILSIIVSGCKKDWLDEKPNTNLVVPNTVKDYQALLDNNDIFNVNEPALGLIAGEQFYLSSAVWQSVPLLTFRNAYIWADDIYQGEEGNSGWQDSYSKILYTNVVLDGIDKLNNNNNSPKDATDNVKGSALFFRAFEFYNLSQIFCKPFIEATSNTDLGLPLRLSSDINIPSVRSTLQQTYDQVINDLESARELLPETPFIRTRPSRQAVDALLARVYLSMENYSKAFQSSNAVLTNYNEVLNFNLLDPFASLPFPNLQTGNPEVIFYTEMQGASMLRSPRLIIDPLLYNQYDDNDLRKTIFFTGNDSIKNFKGYYTGKTTHFAGLATDEMLLVRAECSARSGDAVAAMQDLNLLLQNRYNPSFTPILVSSPEQALTLILMERKKELLLRGIRWSDLRRLNKDDRFKETLSRVINNELYILPPVDPKYTFLLPPEIIRLSNMEQNPR